MRKKLQFISLNLMVDQYLFLFYILYYFKIWRIYGEFLK